MWPNTVGGRITLTENLGFFSLWAGKKEMAVDLLRDHRSPRQLRTSRCSLLYTGTIFTWLQDLGPPKTQVYILIVTKHKLECWELWSPKGSYPSYIALRYHKNHPLILGGVIWGWGDTAILVHKQRCLSA